MPCRIIYLIKFIGKIKDIKPLQCIMQRKMCMAETIVKIHVELKTNVKMNAKKNVRGDNCKDPC